MLARDTHRPEAALGSRGKNGNGRRDCAILGTGFRDIEVIVVSVRLRRSGPQGAKQRRKSWRICWQASKSEGREQRSVMLR
jgi:hypothetical protein